MESESQPAPRLNGDTAMVPAESLIESAEQYALVRLDEAERMLMEASTVEQVKDLRDKAEAIRVYLAQQKGGLRIQNRAATLKLGAERKLGRMLGETIEHGGDPKSHDVTLSNLGIERMQSHRWQIEAGVPEEDFREYVAGCNEKAKEITSVGLYMLGRRLQEPEPVETPPLPEGKYRCIVIDPPWPMQKIERIERPNQGKSLDYPTWNLEQIGELPVPKLAADDGCHVFLWTTHRFLHDAFHIFESWGVRYVCMFVWHKPGGFQPQSLPQYNCEPVLYGRLGASQFLDTSGLFLCFNAPRNGHSVKPDEFYDMLKRVCAEPHLDMFARRKREGFEIWGDEVANLAGG